MEKALIIEFTGLPGSGKSTLNNAVQKALVSKGYKTWSPRKYWQSMGLEQQIPSNNFRKGIIKKLAVILRAIACNMPVMLVVPWRNVLVGHSIRDRYMILNALLSNLAEQEAVTSYVPKDTIALIDEGMVHRAYSLFVLPGGSVNISEVMSYIRAIELPDLLVYVRSNIPDCLDGIVRRGVPARMKRMGVSEALSLLGKGEFLLDTMVEELKCLPSSEERVLEVDGDNLCQAKEKLVNWIDEHSRLIKN